VKYFIKYLNTLATDFVPTLRQCYDLAAKVELGPLSMPVGCIIRVNEPRSRWNLQPGWTQGRVAHH